MTGSAGVYALSADAAGTRVAWTVFNITGVNHKGQFGNAVALVADGSKVLIGAKNVNANGISSGKAEFYYYEIDDDDPGSDRSGNWQLTLKDVVSSIGAGTDPEFIIILQGTAPTALEGRTYTVQMLLAGCLLGAANDNSISPAQASTSIPAATQFEIRPSLVVDYSKVESSVYYSSQKNGLASLAFCVEVKVVGCMKSQ
jgi:hypothetical protein